MGIAAALVIGLLIGLVLGIFISPILLPKQTGAGTNNQVQVSGTVNGKQTGTIYFRTSNESIRTSSPIIDGKYNVLLVGGQSYDIYIDYYHSSSYYTPDFVLYVPLGVTVLTANF
jgi:hypothetical protein